MGRWQSDRGDGDDTATETKPKQQREAVTDRQGEGKEGWDTDRRGDKEIRNEEVTCE